MMREGIVRDPVLLLGDRHRLAQPHDEKRAAAYLPMQEDDDSTIMSRHLPAVVGVAALVAVLGLGSFAYVRWSNFIGVAQPQAPGIAQDQTRRRTEPVVTRRPPPKPVQSSAPQGRPAEQSNRPVKNALPLHNKRPPAQTPSSDLALHGGIPSPLWGTAAGFPGYPQAPLALSGQRPAVPPTPKPAAVAPAAPPEGSPKPITPELTAPQTAVVASGPVAEQPNPHPERPPATPAPARDGRPPGVALHLQIVHAPWGPQETTAVAALGARIEGQMKDVATWGASEWPVRRELILYFFPNDRAAASRVAAILAQITKRTAPPLLLLRTKPAPQPGTIDILLPLRSGEDLKNDNP